MTAIIYRDGVLAADRKTVSKVSIDDQPMAVTLQSKLSIDSSGQIAFATFGDIYVDEELRLQMQQLLRELMTVLILSDNVGEKAVCLRNMVDKQQVRYAQDLIERTKSQFICLLKDMPLIVVDRSGNYEMAPRDHVVTFGMKESISMGLAEVGADWPVLFTELAKHTGMVSPEHDVIDSELLNPFMTVPLVLRVEEPETSTADVEAESSVSRMRSFTYDLVDARS